MLETVGIDGFLRNGREVAKFYKNKRDIAIKAAEKHMKNLCDWIVPAGGMFLWIKVRNVADTKKLILGRGYQKGFLAMPGVGSLVNQNQSSQYLRVSYSDIDQQKADEGFKLLAELIKEEIKEGKNVVKE
ncbi:kynurenine/alpha-aminoadipate aminotransferase, mitochondrial-like [Palaemon carinicauda]|uniref:kynurenine/alpha-aminoadipate aminotransferase, mitochondrial-like n=1 Tax=Palaemon carinicauda TaxID=392227 RepID=UPI0035B6A982